MARSDLRRRVDKKRLCLGCDKSFVSEGAHNRLCFNCRKVASSHQELNITIRESKPKTVPGIDFG